MRSLQRLIRIAALAAAIVAAPGLAIAAGMGGIGGGGTVGAGTMGGMMGGGGMNNMMMGSYGMQTGAALDDPNHPGGAPDPTVRNFSHTGLRNPLPVSKAWQDLPVSDYSAGGALTPVPAMPADGAH